MLLEADRIGRTATGHEAGLLLPSPEASFRDLQQMHCLRATRAVFESWRRAALDAAALLRRANIKSGLASCDSLLLAAGDDPRPLRREFDAREAAGIDAAWMTDKQIRQAARLESGAGLRERGAFALDPYRTCIGLATGAARRGARLFEHSKAMKVRAAARDVEIVLDGGLLRANTVIVATGVATAEFAPLRRHFTPRERYMALTEPLPSAVRTRLFSDNLTLQDAAVPKHRFRWMPDQRLLVSGADQDETAPKRRDAVLVQRTGQLMYEALLMYPVISGVKPELGWSVGYGATSDGLPYIGAHRNYPRHLFALGGDGGSVTGAFLAARILTRALQGAAVKGDDAFAWTRG
jgi:glycine/D-amino acid oxidase-like deaminating enzyme